MFFQELGATLVSAGLHSEDVGVFSLVALDDVFLMLMVVVVVLTAAEPSAIAEHLSEVLPELIAAVAPS